MTGRNRVAWGEGMFLRPQHFQSQDRYFEAYVNARHDRALPFSWGFSALEIDRDLAELGQFAIRSARGIMPDGTPFAIPDDMPPPAPLAISDDVRDRIVYLTLPPRLTGAMEFEDADLGSLEARFLVIENEVADSYSAERASEAIAVGVPNLRLGVSADQTEGRLLLGIARVREVINRKLVFDDRYIPPALDISAIRLRGAVVDIAGRAEQMVDELSLRAAESADGGQDTFRAFLLLQTLNRWTEILRHVGAMPAIHPERLFENFVGMAGEISTLLRKERRAPLLPVYNHEDLRATFDPVIDLLQVLLSGGIESTSEQLQLDERGPGQYLHVVRNKALLRQSYLYLAVHAPTKSLEEVRARFPSISKIGPNTRMRELVRSSLKAGVPLRHTPTPPPQLRVLPGYIYFELDRSAPDWQEIYEAPAMGVFVADDWPNLKLELWAVKQRQ